ncbi:unnamed protein product [Ambrosiozyma monospora]|uniref:Unnamed protein product n=1 Tax=Ambrosiozyma monospora TaxID=43982 RepID=A0ACB5U6D8_AMBMO|nr:unnamed protein product [Ambrosiozyma monospora]
MSRLPLKSRYLQLMKTSTITSQCLRTIIQSLPTAEKLYNKPQYRSNHTISSKTGASQIPKKSFQDIFTPNTASTENVGVEEKKTIEVSTPNDNIEPQNSLIPHANTRIQNSSYYSNYQDVIENHDKTYLLRSASLQDFILSLAPEETTSSDKPSVIPREIKCKTMDGLKDVESAITLLMHCIKMAIDPSYTNEYATNCLNLFAEELDLIPMNLSTHRYKECVFSELEIQKILESSKVQMASTLLKYKLNEEYRWSIVNECRDDHIFGWINSLFADNLGDALYHLSSSKDKIPEIIIYDFLLRKPQNEMEFKTLLWKLYQ